MPTRGVNDVLPVERLSATECWRLLASRAFGRTCFFVGDRVQVVLSAYVIEGDVVYFRASAFGPVARRAQTRPVTLQVDDMSDERQGGWSVTVTGTSHRVSDAATLASLWTPVRPHIWELGLEHTWIALEVDDVTGHRVKGGSARP